MDASRWIILGNPENRRVTMFQAALAARGQPPATAVSWADFLRDPDTLGSLPNDPALLRIDSYGEDFEVEKLLLRRGAREQPSLARLAPEQIARLPYRRGEILAPAQAHRGFLASLDDIERVVATRPEWRVLSLPRAIADLFDKRITSRMYEHLGVPVAPRIDAVTTFDELRTEVRARGWSEVFVKLSCGSSASCLGIYREQSEDFLTTMEITPDGWFNSLRPQRVTQPRALEQVIGFLLAEGAQIEKALPKARLGEDNFDCRIVVIGGEPIFTVVRQSDRPITNLHLGGRRGDVDALMRVLPPELHAAAMDGCRRIGKAHGCLAVGVDLMYEDGFTGYRVLEGNAFGDLLPNVMRDGLSVYEHEIRAALS